MMERTVSLDPRRPLLDTTFVDNGMGTMKGLQALLSLVVVSCKDIEVSSEDRRCSIVILPFFLKNIVAEEKLRS